MKTLEDLIPKITERTNDGTISWSPGINDKTFKTKLGKYFLFVWKWSEPDETEGISIGIKADEKDEVYLDVIGYDTYSFKHSKFEDFYMLARRSTLQLNKIIAEIEVELDLGSLFK